MIFYILYQLFYYSSLLVDFISNEMSIDAQIVKLRGDIEKLESVLLTLPEMERAAVRIQIATTNHQIATLTKTKINSPGKLKDNVSGKNKYFTKCHIFFQVRKRKDIFLPCKIH